MLNCLLRAKQLTMPHSTLSDGGTPLVAEGDDDMPDAPPSAEAPNELPDIEAAQKKDVKLEDMFTDEDSDEEFASPGATKSNIESSPPSAPV